jgi:hypothetical protein
MDQTHSKLLKRYRLNLLLRNYSFALICDLFRPAFWHSIVIVITTATTIATIIAITVAVTIIVMAHNIDFI